MVKAVIGAMFLGSCSVCGDVLAKGRYIVSKSDHNWFRRGFEEIVGERGIIVEDMNFHDGLETQDFLYHIRYVEGKAHITMSRSLQNNVLFGWGNVTIVGEFEEHMWGYRLVLEDGKVVDFMWKGFYIL